MLGKLCEVVAILDDHGHIALSTVSGRYRADAMMIITDARRGIDDDARRSIFLASLIGTHAIAVAVVGSRASTDAFKPIASEFDRLAAALGPKSAATIAIAMVTDEDASGRATVHPTAALAEFLGTLPHNAAPAPEPFRMVVEAATESTINGKLVSGSVKLTEEVVLATSGHLARVTRITVANRDANFAAAGETASIRLEPLIAASPGDVIAAATSRPDVADQFAAKLVWVGEEPMLPGRRYILQASTGSLVASITDLKHAQDMVDYGRIPAKSLCKGDIGLCNFALTEPIAFDAYSENRAGGSFLLLERHTRQSVGYGFIQFALRRATNIQIQRIEIDKHARASIKQQRPIVVWFTGLSGAGKTTVANHVEQRLVAQGRHTYILDGDNLRHGLNKDLGFLAADRVENMRRVGEVAKLMVDAGLIVLVSLISPFRSERQMVRELFSQGEFVEVHVNASLETCRNRDPKGLYKKAAEGKIANFTAVNSPYEAPLNPDILLNSDTTTPEALAEQVLAFIAQRLIAQ